MNAPRTQFLDVPYIGHPEATHRMAYYVWGADDAPPVLCVHGLTRNAHDFDFLAEALSADFRVIAVDVAGRGQSEWLAYTEEYNAACYIPALLQLLNTLNTGPVHWIGTSMGGILGMMIAAGQPERVKKLVLNDIGARIPAAALARIGAYAGKLMQFPSRAAAEKALREIYAPFGIKSEAVWQRLFTYDLQEQPDGSVVRAYDPALAQGFTANTDQPDMDLNPLWSQVRCPVLVIRGENSDILPAAIAEEMGRTHPGMTLHTVRGAGHAPALAEEPELGLIQRWLTSGE